MIIERRRRKNQLTFWIVVLLLFLAIAGYIFVIDQNRSKSQTELIAPVVLAEVLSAQEKSPDETAQSLAKIDNSNLQKIVADDLAGTSGTYAVVVKNMKTGEHYELNGEHVFESGSLYKLWIMATVYQAEEKGNLDDNQELSESVENLNQKFQIDPSVAEMTDGVIDYTVHDALYKMITISDNYTALLLTSKIRLSTVASYLVSQNFDESSVGVNGDAPTTTASDIENFFEQLYKGTLASPDYNQKMLDLLKQQKLNGKIPKELPDNLAIAHKTGELDTFSHDAGIIYSPKGDYILILMSDSDNPPAAEDRISAISKDIYAYFTGGGEGNEK
jgi:beta-lactamase class A